VPLFAYEQTVIERPHVSIFLYFRELNILALGQMTYRILGRRAFRRQVLPDPEASFFLGDAIHKFRDGHDGLPCFGRIPVCRFDLFTTLTLVLADIVQVRLVQHRQEELLVRTDIVQIHRRTPKKRMFILRVGRNECRVVYTLVLSSVPKYHLVGVIRHIYQPVNTHRYLVLIIVHVVGVLIENVQGNCAMVQFP